MEFKKYNSLENSYRGKFIESINSQVSPEMSWVALEKIHGANFSFWIANDRQRTTRVASRTQFVEPESFFNCREVVERNIKGAQAIAKEHLEGYDGPDIESVTVFGELCGGTGQDYAQVQKEVFYSYDQQFIVFDIMLSWKSGEVTYLGVQDVMMACLKTNMIMAPIVGTGSLVECLDMSPEFLSLIPGVLGVEPPDNNLAEGLVLRPKRDTFLRNGKRAILKQKAKKFSEKSNAKVKKPVVLSEEGQQHLDQFAGYLLNENRLSAVLSKIGQVDHTMTGKLIGLMISDALEDYIKDNEVDPSKSLDKAEWKKIVKTLNPQLAQMILRNLE